MEMTGHQDELVPEWEVIHVNRLLVYLAAIVLEMYFVVILITTFVVLIKFKILYSLAMKIIDVKFGNISFKPTKLH